MNKILMRSAIALTACAVLASASTALAAGKDTKEVTGVIVSVDKNANTVTVRHKDSTMTFTVASDVQFGHGGEKVKGMTIADLKIGDKVVVQYTIEGDKVVAHKFGRVENTNKEMKKKRS
jgi:Cu/Ag efflux protein CusF